MEQSPLERIEELASAIIKIGSVPCTKAWAEEILLQCGIIRETKDEIMEAACGERCYYSSICNNAEGLESYCNDCEMGNKLEELFG